MYDPYEELRQLVKREQVRAIHLEQERDTALAKAKQDAELWSLAGQRIEHLEWQTSELIEQLAAVTAERDALQREVHELQWKLPDYPPIAVKTQPTCRTCGERTCCEGHDCDRGRPAARQEETGDA